MTVGASDRDEPSPVWRVVWACFALGLFLRLLAAGFVELSHDAAVFYLPNARAFLLGGLGNWDEVSIAIPPLFPTMVAIVAQAIPGEDHVALELAALMISVVAGAAVVFPVHALTRAFFPGHTPAHLLAPLFAAIQPFLVEASGDGRVDPLYTLLFMSALVVGRKILERGTIGRGALFGLLLGSGYLLRPEMLGLAILLAAGTIVAFVRRLRRGEEANRYAVSVALAGVSAIVLLVPCLAWNMTLVHHRIGIWTLSPKAAPLLSFDKKGNGHSFSRLNEEKTMVRHEEMNSQPGAFPEFSLIRTFSEHPGEMIEAVLRNLGDFIKFFPDVMGGCPLLLFTAGLVASVLRRKIDDRGRQALWILVTVLTFYALSFSIFYMTRRLWCPFIPLTLPWCGLGAALLLHLRGRDWAVGPKVVMAVILVATLPQTLHAIGIGELTWWNTPERILGARLSSRAGVGADTLFVSAKGKVAWHAGGRNLPFPTGHPLEDITAYMRNRGADYLVFDRRRYSDRFPEILEEIDGSPEFVPVDSQKGNRKDLRVLRLVKRD